MNYFLKILISIFALLLIIISVYFTFNIKLDASSDTLILKNDKTFEYFEYYNNIFPSKNFLILAVKSNKNIDENYLQNVQKLNEKIKNLKNVESTLTILDAPILLSNNITLSELANSDIETIRNTNIDNNIILDEFSNSPILKDQLINKDKNLTSIIIYTKKNDNLKELRIKKNQNELNNDERKNIKRKYNLEKIKYNNDRDKLILDIREIISTENNEYKYYLGGIDMIASDTISFVKNDIKIFGFAVLIFIVFVLFLIYRDIKWVIIPLITTVYSVLFMTGFVGFMKWEITAISSNFISLMLILSISMNIHIVNHYRIHSIDNTITNKLYYTMTKMFWPCLYTGLTTIVAFSSLLFSNIKPIIDFGFIMVFALLFIFLSSFTILPLLISFFPKIKKDKIKRFFILDLFYKISIKNTYIIFSINLIFICFSIYGINKLNVENSFINYFKSNTEIHKGMKLIDTELGGTTPIDVIIKFNKDKFDIDINDNIENDDEDLIFEDEIFLEEDLFSENISEESWFTDEKIITIKKIHQYLESRKEIGKVQSIYSLIEMGNLINKKELTNFEISILYKEMPENYKIRLINPFLSTENNMVKINARVKDSYEINRNQLIFEIKKYIESEFNNVDTFEINGLLVLYNNMLQSLFDSQLKSFGIILLAIFVMFLILFQSIKLSIFGMIPNIIASTFILGLIGNLGIPLDIMTITIAAITIGIAVDNTIHYIYRVKENKNNIIEESIKKAHNNVGNAVLTTSLTIAFGFSVLILSNFIPTILFGLFTALAMILAMLGVLITLPTLIYKYKNANK
tara:strand:+ start:28 stop:2439 length:2412 start_codon:yes stop_codon:yes gene_type:complete